MSFPEVFVYETWSKNRLLSSSFHGTPGAYRMALDAGGTDGEDTFFLCFRNNNDPVLDGMLDPSFRVLPSFAGKAPSFRWWMKGALPVFKSVSVVARCTV